MIPKPDGGAQLAKGNDETYQNRLQFLHCTQYICCIMKQHRKSRTKVGPSNHQEGKLTCQFVDHLRVVDTATLPRHGICSSIGLPIWLIQGVKGESNR